jgi:hypothetical protein
MRLFLLRLGACVILGATATVAHAQDSVWTSKRRPNATPAAVQPLAGEYNCHMLAAGGVISTPYGAAPTVTAMPSAIVRLQLDGRSTYQHASGDGRYRYDQASGRVIVESGPFAGWTVRSESDGRGRWLRFAAEKDAELAPTSRLGDHICSLR